MRRICPNDWRSSAYYIWYTILTICGGFVAAFLSSNRVNDDHHEISGKASFDYSKRKKEREKEFDESNAYEVMISREREIYQIVYKIKMWLCVCVHACLQERETRLGEQERKGECGVWLCAHIYLSYKYIYHYTREAR